MTRNERTYCLEKIAYGVEPLSSREIIDAAEGRAPALDVFEDAIDHQQGVAADADRRIAKAKAGLDKVNSTSNKAINWGAIVTGLLLTALSRGRAKPRMRSIGTKAGLGIAGAGAGKALYDEHSARTAAEAAVGAEAEKARALQTAEMVSDYTNRFHAAINRYRDLDSRVPKNKRTK